MICCKIPWNEIFYGDIIHNILSMIILECVGFIFCMTNLKLP